MKDRLFFRSARFILKNFNDEPISIMNMSHYNPLWCTKFILMAMGLAFGVQVSAMSWIHAIKYHLYMSELSRVRLSRS